MPQIIVTADRDSDRAEGTVMLRERINASDFESDTSRRGWSSGSGGRSVTPMRPSRADARAREPAVDAQDQLDPGAASATLTARHRARP